MARSRCNLRSRIAWKTAVLVTFGGGVLLQASCATIFAPDALSLGESTLLTILFSHLF